jgi:general secretion pathway protein F
MPAFSYEAVDAQGKSSRGVIEADSARAARAQLRGRELLPMRVEPLQTDSPSQGPWLQRELWPTRALDATQLAIFTRQLASLVGAGLPIERALTVLADEAPDKRQQNLLAALRAQINGGASLAKALAEHPREFDDTFRAVVAAGEQSGELSGVLESLASELEATLALRAKLLGAALYPAIVSLVALAIVIFLLGYVVPQVAEVFTGSKRALPLLTVVMLSLSDLVRAWGLWALVLLAGGALALPCATAPCGAMRSRRWCWCARVPRWPRPCRPIPVFQRCCPCLPAWASRPARSRRCCSALPPSSAARCSGAPCNWPPCSSRF